MNIPDAKRLFSPEKCIHRLRLTLLDHQIEIATDSLRIFQIISNIFANQHFAPGAEENLLTFYCSVYCDPPWLLAMDTPDGIHVLRSSEEHPMNFDVFLWSPDGFRSYGSFTHGEFGSFDTTLEFFAAIFQRRIMRDLLNYNSALRLVHAGSLQFNGAGLMILAPTKGGKSTLTLAGLLAGMKFLSDDYTLVNLHSGELLPFPRAMRFRKSSSEMFPDFGHLCNGITIDAAGETRYYINLEQVADDTVGSGAPITHVVKLDGFWDKPVFSAISPGIMAGVCTEFDCFAGGDQALDLIWQWSDLLKDAWCMELKAGFPMETASMLLDLLRKHGDSSG